MKIIVTGGAGFIGVNTALRFSKQHDVLIIDDLSRVGADKNLKWVSESGKVTFQKIDVRDAKKIASAVKEFKPDAVFHLAAQVAVTTSVVEPRFDFEVNALGSFNVLEAVRLHAPEALVVYSSTNKVYGGMEDVGVVRNDQSYGYQNLPNGVPESRPLDFHSPYGCSKGAADQYFMDYARIYNLHTVSFRQSCIYGPRQFGVEDQGWVAWFTIASHFSKPITIFGDGMQVRDVLWIDDLVDLYELTLQNKSQLKGQAFNIGGGCEKTMSLLQLLDYLNLEMGAPITHSFSDWRPGDQKVYISDITLAKNFFNWNPQVTPQAGVKKLRQWVAENQALFFKGLTSQKVA